jgi:hypothetical protein
MMDATKATIYKSPCQTTELKSSQIKKALPHWKIIAIFQQISNIYIAPNYMFLYRRKITSIKSTTSPIFNDLNQKIHNGMMNAISDEVDGLAAVLTEIASLEQGSMSVSQIGESSISYACLTNKSEIEFNLVENEQKDILVAPAIDADAQKEAAHNSGARSTLNGF